MMKWKDERDELLELLPKEPETNGSGYFELDKFIPNARVFIRNGEVTIYPLEGGVLSCPIDDMGGDIAPFHG